MLKRPIKVLGLALYGPLAASHRVRLGQYQGGLAELGIDLQIQSLLGDAYVESRFHGGQLPLARLIVSGFDRLGALLDRQSYDAAIVHCELFPLLPGGVERMLLHVPYIYDFDDAFYMRYRGGRLGVLRSILGSKFDVAITGAAAVTAGNAHLANYALALNQNTVIFPSVVDTTRYLVAPRHVNSVFTVGWVGSPSTAEYLKQLIAPLAELGAQMPIRLVVVGGKAPVIQNVDVVELPWQADTEVDVINTFDVGVMPLPDDDWARGKCAFKLIQYMACGVPVVASRVGANVDVVTPDCGYVVSDQAGWIDALSQLREQAWLRLKMGAAARERIQSKYSLATNLPVLAQVIRKVVIK